QFQDNSFAFFSYLFEKGRRDIFFVIDRAAINAATSQRFGRNIVAYRSFRHILLIYRAKFLIINDGYRDVYPSGSLLRSMNTPFIYLQHGILRYKSIYINPSHYYGRISRFVVSTDHEELIATNKLASVRDTHALRRFAFLKHLIDAGNPAVSRTALLDFASLIDKSLEDAKHPPFLSSAADDYKRSVLAFAERVGFPTNRVLKTGLPRHDRLKALIEKHRHGGKTSVFIFLTWRDYWSSAEDFSDTSPIAMIRDIIESPGFKETIESNGLTIEICLHQKMGVSEVRVREALRGYDVVVHNAAFDMQMAIVRTAVLITDYSSSSLDFTLASVPVIFYQPDKEQFYRSRGHYVDDPSDWVGPIITDASAIGHVLTAKVAAAANPNTSALLASYRNFGSSNESLARGLDSPPPSIWFVCYNTYG